MLASTAAVMPLRPTPPLSETQRSLRDLQQAREALVRDRGAARDRLAPHSENLAGSSSVWPIVRTESILSQGRAGVCLGD